MRRSSKRTGRLSRPEMAQPESEVSPASRLTGESPTILIAYHLVLTAVFTLVTAFAVAETVTAVVVINVSSL